jgi:hypothetical protein
MKRLGFILLIISILILVVGCSQEEIIDPEGENYIDKSLENERTYFHEEDYTEYFQEMYMLENLKDHEVYSVDNDVNFTFNFKKELTTSEVKNIDGFFHQVAFEDIPPIGGPLYGKEIYNMKPIDSMTYRIFIEDDLLQYKSFDFNSGRGDYYENMTLDVSRPLKDDNEEAYIKSLEDISLFIKSVKIIKPYKGFVVYFNIDTYFSLTDQTIKEIQGIVEEEIAPVLEEKDIEKYGMNTSALGIIINFKNGKNKQLVYFNGEDKKWIDVDWQRFDFFSKNQK